MLLGSMPLASMHPWIKPPGMNRPRMKPRRNQCPVGSIPLGINAALDKCYWDQYPWDQCPWDQTPCDESPWDESPF